MKQALHIFKKDVRYLRWEIAAVLLFMALFAWTETSAIRINRYVRMPTLLPFVWAFLCARLIQAEPIPGDRQFWITRPYRWRSLLGAKLLFVAAFIGLPLMLADAVILRLQGFSIAVHLPGLLWGTLLNTLGVPLTFVALAALTRTLTQWVLSMALIVAFALGFSNLANENIGEGGVTWMLQYGTAVILMLTALPAMLIQYRLRRTPVSATLLALGIIAAQMFLYYAPRDAALALETRFSRPKVDPAPIQLAIGAPSQTVYSADRWLGELQKVVLRIPVEVSGLTDSQDVISDDVHLVIQNAKGEKWSPRSDDRDYLEHVPGGYRITPSIDRRFFDQAKGQPVHLHLTFYLTTVGNPQSTVLRPGDSTRDVAGVGRCRFEIQGTSNSMVCASPLRESYDLLQIKLGEERWGQFVSTASYSPFPADSSIVPLHRYWHSGRPDFAPATLTTLEPLAHFRRDLDLPAFNLAAYQVSPRL